jgi:ParB/RepB/Spo0J family partition protein
MEATKDSQDLGSNEPIVSRDIYQRSETIPLDRITTSGKNPRKSMDEEQLISLMRDMASNGLMQPVLVRPIGPEFGGRYELVVGHRRLESAKRLGWNEIRCTVQEMSDDDSFERMGLENLDREDLSPLDTAMWLKEAWERAKARGEKQEDLAKRLGKSQGWLSNKLRVASAPEPLLQLYAQGRISDKHVLQVLPFQEYAIYRGIVAYLDNATKEGTVSSRKLEQEIEQMIRRGDGTEYCLNLDDFPVNMRYLRGLFDFSKCDGCKEVRPLIVFGGATHRFCLDRSCWADLLNQAKQQYEKAKEEPERHDETSDEVPNEASAYDGLLQEYKELSDRIYKLPATYGNPSKEEKDLKKERLQLRKKLKAMAPLKTCWFCCGFSINNYESPCRNGKLDEGAVPTDACHVWEIARGEGYLTEECTVAMQEMHEEIAAREAAEQAAEDEPDEGDNPTDHEPAGTAPWWEGGPLDTVNGMPWHRAVARCPNGSYVILMPGSYTYDSEDGDLTVTLSEPHLFGGPADPLEALVEILNGRVPTIDEVKVRNPTHYEPAKGEAANVDAATDLPANSFDYQIVDRGEGMTHAENCTSEHDVPVERKPSKEEVIARELPRARLLDSHKRDLLWLLTEEGTEGYAEYLEILLGKPLEDGVDIADVIASLTSAQLDQGLVLMAADYYIHGGSRIPAEEEIVKYLFPNSKSETDLDMSDDIGEVFVLNNELDCQLSMWRDRIRRNYGSMDELKAIVKEGGGLPAMLMYAEYEQVLRRSQAIKERYKALDAREKERLKAPAGGDRR